MQFSLTRGGKKNARRAISILPRVFCGSVLQPAMVTSQRQVMLHLPSQHHLCVLQGLVIEQPVQLCPLCRGVAVPILDGDAVDGKSGAIREQGFHPVGVHVVVAGKQFRHSRILQDLIFGVRSLEPMPSSRCRINRFFICLRVSARFLRGFCTVSKRAKGANRCKSDKECRNSKLKTCDVSQKNNVKT